LRIWPVFVLGHRFSGLVAIQPGHTLVTSRVYRLIRRPSYVGLLVNSLGWALAFRSGVGAAYGASFTAARRVDTGGREAAALAVRRRVRWLLQTDVAPSFRRLLGSLPPNMRSGRQPDTPSLGRSGFGALAPRYASIASLAESSIDILLWTIPLKSHFADAAQPILRPSSSAPARSCAARHAAVNHELRACHVAGGIGGEKEHAVCYILRLPRPAEWYPCFGDLVRVNWFVAACARRYLRPKSGCRRPPDGPC
jgi:hypothetical protein